MREVYIVGSGQIPVSEHFDASLRDLAWQAITPALHGTGVKVPDGIFVGNMLAGQLSHQQHIGTLIADFCGFRGTEAIRVEASGASGGAALRVAYLAIRSGELDTALVVGVEKMTDKFGSEVVSALSTDMDGDWEAAHGATAPAIAALIMQRYMHEHNVTLRDFAEFSVNSHSNAHTNPNAFLRNRILPEEYVKAPMVAPPINRFDCAPDADGAAAIVLAAGNAAPRSHPLARITASAIATDALALHDRSDPLTFMAARQSAQLAYEQANIRPNDVDVFELFDRFTIYAALSLEAADMAARGEGWKLAQKNGVRLDGRIPISTFGGLKARGNCGGATGVYQIAELVQQLLGEASDNQVTDAHCGMAQCLGASAATAVTHVLERVL